LWDWRSSYSLTFLKSASTVIQVQIPQSLGSIRKPL
jgi:hypothetical protein